MENIKEKLSGVYAPLVTPFEEDEILYDALAQNVERMNKTGLRGYFVLGTNGEFKSLSVEERMEVLRVVAGCASNDKVIMAGTSAESTKETLDITMKAVKAGAQMVSLLAPSFFAKRMDDGVLTDYILSIAEESPVPVLVYNNPSVTAGVNVSPEVVRRVSGHPMVAGMKDSSKGNFQEYIKASREGFYVLAGSAAFFLDLLMAGGIGGVLSLANVFPGDCVRLYRAFVEGRQEEARKINANLVSLNKEVSGTYGVAGVKAAMDIVGYRGGATRRPLKALAENQMGELKKKLVESGFFKEA